MQGHHGSGQITLKGVGVKWIRKHALERLRQISEHLAGGGGAHPVSRGEAHALAVRRGEHGWPRWWGHEHRESEGPVAEVARRLRARGDVGAA